ncbi:MAG: hypothetical protein WDW38_005447 [Sanguina aurantia]
MHTQTHPRSLRHSSASGTSRSWQSFGSSNDSRSGSSSQGSYQGSSPSSSSSSSSSSQGSYQGFSSSSGSSSSSSKSGSWQGSQNPTGPPVDRLRALPYLILPSAAEAAFQGYQQQNPLLSPAKQWESMKEVLLPFFMCRAQARAVLNSAQLGFHRTSMRYNPSTRSHEPTVTTVWESVRLHRRFDSEYAPEEHAGMQTYASFKYPRSDIDVLRPGPLLQLARSLDPEMLKSSSGSPGTLRTVGPFTMRPEAARHMVGNWIRYLPSLRHTLHTVARGYETETMARLGAAGAASFEEEWVREYLGREEARRFADESPPHHEEDTSRQQQRRERRSGRQRQGEQQAILSPTAIPLCVFPQSFRDPQGYYKRLGVSNTASTSDIQAAFRAAALTHHPDRQQSSDPAVKANATKTFQAILEAYSVLRDPRKRERYDFGETF